MSHVLVAIDPNESTIACTQGRLHKAVRGGDEDGLQEGHGGDTSGPPALKRLKGPRTSVKGQLASADALKEATATGFKGQSCRKAHFSAMSSKSGCSCSA